MENIKYSDKELIDLEKKHGAMNYHPLPVVISKGFGVLVWDVNGKCYYDFLSAYSAVNQGHCHPKIIDNLQQQAEKLTLTSRAFYNDQLGIFEKFVTEIFGFDKMLPMNTGAEGVETAIKICRKWGYEKKKIKENQAQIVVFNKNFHGRTTSIISFSDDETATKNFGPFNPGFIKIPYNDPSALEQVIKEHPNIVGVLVEPIQGEAGVFVPSSDFISKINEICKKNNILFIADEIQTGLARTGSMLAVCGDCSCTEKCERQKNYVKPDILILGKALSGGTYPISAVLADNSIMDVITPGTHGSTYGGNPLAAKVGKVALEVLLDEKLMVNARKMGNLFRERLQKLITKNGLVKEIRGRGLLNAMVINDTPTSSTAWDICVKMMENGLLAKPTHGNIIRFAPPLVINEEQINKCCDIIEKTILEFKK